MSVVFHLLLLSEATRQLSERSGDAATLPCGGPFVQSWEWKFALPTVRYAHSRKTWPACPEEGFIHKKELWIMKSKQTPS